MIRASHVRYSHRVRSHRDRREGGEGGSARGGGSDGEASLPVVVVGLGPIGRLTAAAALKHPDLELIGAVDPRHAGERFAALVPGAPDGVVERSAEALYRKARGGIALICTGSTLDEVAPEVEAAVRAGVGVVSSCEELANAPFVDPELAGTLDAAARKSGVSILGAGIAPGFVLDRLVVTLGAVSGDVRLVVAERRVDADPLGGATLDRLGIGIDPDRFGIRAEEGTVGHVGLAESCALVADGLGLSVDEIEEEIEPIVAEVEIRCGERAIPPGKVHGVRQVAKALDEGREVIRLTLEVAAGVSSRDRIRIDGDPPIEVEIPSGIDGPRATAWSLVHAAPRVAASEPGILSVLDLPAGR
ncbi:MAG TPA: dihydrodipicolinate reductase [Vulgatibacter sp.]